MSSDVRLEQALEDRQFLSGPTVMAVLEPLEDNSAAAAAELEDVLLGESGAVESFVTCPTYINDLNTGYESKMTAIREKESRRDENAVSPLQPTPPAFQPPAVVTVNVENELGKGAVTTSKRSFPGDHACSWGDCCKRPECCQRFANAKCALVWLSMAGTVQGMIVNGFVLSTISTIERRYDMKSADTGFIASSYDLASLACLLPVSYIGGRGKKMKWVSVGTLVMALGSLLYALPQFTAAPYERGRISEASSDSETVALCSPTSKHAPATCQSRLLSDYKYVFILSQLMHGSGASPLFTLGVTYLDENLRPKTSAFYLGIFHAMAIVGPAIGFLAGGAFLNVYTDFLIGESEWLTPESRAWIGAWWIGFLLSAAIGILVSAMLFGFPRTLAYRSGSEDISEAYGDSERQSSDISGTITDVPKTVKMLFANPTFVFLSLAGCTEGMTLSGLSTFSPKFVEYQFGVRASWASQLVGFVAIPAGGGGTLIGAYLIKRFDLKCKAILRMCFILVAVSLGFSCAYIVQCGNVSFAGVTIPYPNTTARNLTSLCNADCGCSTSDYSPVCGVRNLVTYYSPCHAGCAALSNSTRGITGVYEDCSCAAGELEEPPSSPPLDAVDGQCPSTCKLLTVFLPLFLGASLFTFLASMPALSATLRCVPRSQKSFALGIQWALVRAFGKSRRRRCRRRESKTRGRSDAPTMLSAFPGSIPAGPLYGSLIDRACILWNEGCAGLDGESPSRGSCYLYDNSKMGTYMLSTTLAAKFLSCSFFYLAMILYKPPEPSTVATATLQEEVAVTEKDAKKRAVREDFRTRSHFSSAV